MPQGFVPIAGFGKEHSRNRIDQYLFQATTNHLRRFGAIDIPASQYLVLLKRAIGMKCEFG